MSMDMCIDKRVGPVYRHMHIVLGLTDVCAHCDG